MKNRSRTSIIFFIFTVLMTGCAHTGAPGTGLDKTFKLVVVPKVGGTEITQYHSRAINRIFQDGTLQKKSKDDMDFQVKTTIKKVEPMADRIEMKVETLAKSGDGNLHEFAIPEMGELINMAINGRAEVLSVDKFPKGSIFYLPTISLPKSEVQVGDSWDLSVAWATENQGIPLKMELVSILKEIRKCENEHCALIELDGDVHLNGPKQADLDLKSTIRGYLYFSLETGSVVWSHIRSDQELHFGKIINKFRSCLVSYVTSPERRQLSKKVSPFCEPEEDMSPAVIP